jgi:hypothetical protein
MMRIDRYLIAFSLLVLAKSAGAAVFCVDTSSGLQAALTTAASNGQDDEIQIVQGVYEGNFIYASSEAKSINLKGGYNSGCKNRTLNPINTVFDGKKKNTVIALSTANIAANHLIEGITIRNGQRNGSGGGVYAVTNGNFTLSQNIIENNSVTGFYDDGGGAYIYASFALIGQNNFDGNQSPDDAGGFYLIANQSEIRHR